MKHGDFGDFNGSVWGLTQFPGQPEEATGGPAVSSITVSPLSLSKARCQNREKKALKKNLLTHFWSASDLCLVHMITILAREQPTLQSLTFSNVFPPIYAL